MIFEWVLGNAWYLCAKKHRIVGKSSRYANSALKIQNVLVLLQLFYRSVVQWGKLYPTKSRVSCRTIPLHGEIFSMSFPEYFAYNRYRMLKLDTKGQLQILDFTICINYADTWSCWLACKSSREWFIVHTWRRSCVCRYLASAGKSENTKSIFSRNYEKISINLMRALSPLLRSAQADLSNKSSDIRQSSICREISLQDWKYSEITV